MKYQKPCNVWDMQPEQIAKLQPGQWIFAGMSEDNGRFLGLRKSGSVVVAWLGNERNQGNMANRRAYVRTLRDYAKTV